MARRQATIDRELFEEVRRYALSHDKEKSCHHFGIALSTLNNILRYNSFEEMRFKIREKARERYALSKAKKQSKKEVSMPQVEVPAPVKNDTIEPPQPSGILIKPINEELSTLQETIKNLTYSNDKLLAERTRLENLLKDNDAAYQGMVQIANSLQEKVDDLTEQNKILQERITNGMQANQDLTQRLNMLNGEGQAVIEIGKIRITVTEGKC